MTRAFHVRAIGWDCGQVRLYGENREIGPQQSSGQRASTYMVAWLPPDKEDDPCLCRAKALDREAAFAFLVFLPLLFIAQFEKWGALEFSGVVLWFAAGRYRQLCTLLREHCFALLLLSWAGASMLWSPAPLETLKHVTEFAITIIAALLLASSRNPRSMLLGMLAAFVLHACVVIANGNMVDVGADGTRALAGLNNSKNEAASIAGTGIFLSVFLFLLGVRTRRLVECMMSIAASLLDAYVLFAARSTGATVALGAAVSVLVLVVMLRKVPAFGRACLLGVIALSAAFAICFFEFYGGTAREWIAAALQKDPTLTGRTYLWYRARELMAEHPLLGQGFGAFWRQGNLDAEGLWQFAGISSRQGFNFHNTFYDAFVSLGLVGALILAATFALGLVRMGTSYIVRPTFLACFWLALAVNLFIRMPTESVGLNEFYFSTVLLFAALGSGQPLLRSLALPMRPSLFAFSCPVAPTLPIANGGVAPVMARLVAP